MPSTAKAITGAKQVGAYAGGWGGGGAATVGAAVGAMAQGIITGRPYTLPAGQSPVPPPAGWLMLVEADAGPRARALYLRTTREPTMPEADSGWETVEIPFWVDATRWRSGKPLRFDAEVSLNALGVTRERGEPVPDVDDEWRQLEKLWRPKGGVKPPTLRIAGPVARQDLPWVITSVQASPDTIVRHDNRLVAVVATISFSQYVNPGVPEVTVPRDADLATEDRPNFTISKQGDTLRKIAKRDPPDGLGDGRKWVELRKLNPAYKTANQHIPTGTRIRLPNG